MTHGEKTDLSRRSFVKGTTLSALAAVAGGGGLFGCAPQQEETDLAESGVKAAGFDPEREDGEVIWNSCVFCGFTRCPMRFHVKDGLYLYTEADNTGSPEFGGIQARACLRGRTQAMKLNHPDRLKYPMKRTGKRGSGEFERISWDEAIDTIVSEYKRVVDTWGNEAVMSNYNFYHFFNVTGGSLTSYGNDSSGAIMAAAREARTIGSLGWALWEACRTRCSTPTLSCTSAPAMRRTALAAAVPCIRWNLPARRAFALW